MLVRLDELGGIEDAGRGTLWTSAMLRREIGARAAVLTSAGLGRGDVVAVAHGGSASYFADLLAIWHVGATAACLDPALTAYEQSILLEFMQPAAVLVDDHEAACVQSVPHMMLSGIAGSVETPAAAEINPEEAALVLFTSGTTGEPKGVVLSFRALSMRLGFNVGQIGRPALDRSLVTLPSHFGHGLIGNSLTPLMAGGDIVLAPLGMPLAQNLSHLVDEYSITFLSSVPAFWRLAVKVAASPLKGTLKRVHVGSAPLSAGLWTDIVNWSGAEVVNCYGMTEAANWIAGASSHDAISDGLVGKPWGGIAAVSNGDSPPRPVGEGEILVRSPSLMSRYLHRPDLTSQVLRDGWLHTGDRGTIDIGGNIRLTGRIKDEINRAGLKVQPVELDMLLETHPAVAEACTFGLHDAVSGELVAAAVRLEPGVPVEIDALRSWCRTRLRREMVPERWFVVDNIPRTPQGKVNRAMVSQRLVEQHKPTRCTPS
ncbi:MAG: class I adenylate-forming enzyme family protein [bacterium]